MRIRITRIPIGEADGVDLRTLEVGLSYDVSPTLGAHLVATRCGELIASQEPMLLVGLHERIGYGVAAAYGVADDRGQRLDSILSFAPAGAVKSEGDDDRSRSPRAVSEIRRKSSLLR